MTPRAHLTAAAAVVGALAFAAPVSASDLQVSVFINGQQDSNFTVEATGTTALKGSPDGNGFVNLADFGTAVPGGFKTTVTIHHETLGSSSADYTFSDSVNLGVVTFDHDGSIFSAYSPNADVTLDPPLGDGVSNDDCDNASAIGLGTTAGSTAGATLDTVPGAFCGTSVTAPGVWYSVTGTGNEMTASTCGAFFGYDTKLSVFCNDCGLANCVGGNDDNCPAGASGLLSTVSWCSQAGANYLILVHGFGSQTGDFELTVSDGGACGGAIECIPPAATGACCFSDGSCEVLTEDECAAGSGAYQGDDTACFGDATGVYSGGSGAIPDLGGGSLTDVIAVGDSFTVTDVNVGLNVSHTWQGDLSVDLNKGATTVRIIDRPGEPALGAFGCSEDNWLDIVIDDEGTDGPIENACAPNLVGSFTPNNALSAFDGADSAGNWSLTITDNAAGDTGTLDGWTLDLSDGGTGEPLCPEPECFLVVGNGTGADPYVGGGHVFTTQIGDIQAGYFTLMEQLPEFVMPAAPTRNGNSLIQGMGQGVDPNADVPEWMLDGNFSVQILMWNPGVFPAMPEQFTTGMHVQILPSGRVLTQPFGSEQGGVTFLDVNVSVNGDGQKIMTFPFNVDGL